MINVARQSALSYLHALYNGDIDTALTYCDDDIDVIAFASIAIFPDLGHRRGKTAVAESLRGAFKNYMPTWHEVVSLVSEDEKVAAMLRVGLKNVGNGRVVSLDCAHFFKIRGSRISEIRSFLDSFDVLEQVLGRDLTTAFGVSAKLSA